MRSDIHEIEIALNRLNAAVANNRSKKYCLKLWSKFVRLRDNNRCVICGSGNHLSAHHVFRKSLLKNSIFQTGNGISLCKSCHEQPHEVFNGKPDLELPMDTEGGEDIDLAMDFLTYLIADGEKQKILRDDFYFFSDHTLSTFKVAQGIDPHLPFPGKRIEQTHLIWMQTPRSVMRAILGAQGCSLPQDLIQSGSFFIVSDNGAEQTVE